MIIACALYSDLVYNLYLYLVVLILYFSMHINFLMLFSYSRDTLWFLLGRGWSITFRACKCQAVVWTKEKTGKQTREDCHSTWESIQSSREEDTSSACSGSIQLYTCDQELLEREGWGRGQFLLSERVG